MGRVFAALAFWAVAWLIIAGFIQLDLNGVVSANNMGRGTIILGLLGILPPIFTVAVILQAIKDSSAQSLFRRIANGVEYPTFALYLRAFEYDVAAREPRDDFAKVAHTIDNIWKSDRSLSALTAGLLKRDCGVEQVVAIMPPKGSEPLSMEMHHGAGRIEAKSVGWQEAVLALAKTAKVIVIAAGASRGVQWEFDQLRLLGRLRSTVLIMPPAMPGTSNPLRQRTLEWVQSLGSKMPFDSDSGFALTFNAEGKVHRYWQFQILAERGNQAQLSEALRYANTSDTPKPLEPPTDETPIQKLVADVDVILGKGLDEAIELKERGEFDRALAVEKKLLEAQTRTFGTEHEETLKTLHNMAVTYRLMGNVKAALEIQGDLPKKMAAIHGPESPITIRCIDNFAVTLTEAGEYEAAIVGHETALELAVQHLGEDSNDVLEIKGNLARVLALTGDALACHALQTEVYQARRASLGVFHPVTLSALQHLVVGTLAIGDVKGAKQLAGELLAERSEALGARHPDTLLARKLVEDLSAY
jgi:hypothetical protein